MMKPHHLHNLLRIAKLLQEIRAQLEESRDSVAGLAKRLQVIMLYKGIMPAFDKTCPGGTKRRNAIIRIYDKLGGTRL